MEEVTLEDLDVLSPQERNKREYVWSSLQENKSVDTRNILNTFARLPQFLTLDSTILREVIVRIEGRRDNVESEELDELYWLYETLYNNARQR